VTDVALEDSEVTAIRHKWHRNHGFVKAMIVSNYNLAIAVVEAKKVGVKVSAKRAMDEEDSDVEVVGVKKAAINK
jgi:metal-dependent HD superfamily phosphatase/phosphodiesterase